MKSKFIKKLYLVLFFHGKGDNVLGKEQVEGIFQALDTVRNLTDYDKVCSKSSNVDRYGKLTCEISGVTTFWNDTTSIFANQVSSDEQATVQMSATTFPDGTPVTRGDIMGLAQANDQNLLVSAQSYTVVIRLPEKLADLRPVVPSPLDGIDDDRLLAEPHFVSGAVASVTGF